MMPMLVRLTGPYEPTTGGSKGSTSNLNNNGGSKNGGSGWDTLPRSHSTSSFINNNLGGDVGSGEYPDMGTLRRVGPGGTSGTHTLTKTNPYRHKVLTNGSFLNLNMKDKNHSDDGGSNSSRPTTSTEDNHSETSSDHKGHQPINTASVVSLKRSNTSKSFAERYGEHVLPPPDTFGDTPRYPN